MFNQHIGATGQYDITDGDETYISCVEFTVYGFTGSMIPQIKQQTDGSFTAAAPNYFNAAYVNGNTGASYAAGTAITADGRYIIDTTGGVLSLNVTDAGDGDFNVYGKPFLGPSPTFVSSSGGGGGAVTVADGADVALGTTTDAAVGDATGTLISHSRMSAKAAGQGAADNSTNSTFKAPVIVGTANAAAPTWTEARQAPISLDLAGNTRVIPAATEVHLGQVGGTTPSVAVEIIRPADTTAYTAGDSVNTSTSAPTIITFANAVRVASGTGYVTKARITTNQSTNVAAYRLWFFSSATPTITNDNAAFNVVYADAGICTGYIDFAACSTELGGSTDCAFAELGQDGALRLKVVGDASKNVFCLLETKTTFTPTSGQKFNIKLSFDQN